MLRTFLSFCTVGDTTWGISNLCHACCHRAISQQSVALRMSNYVILTVDITNEIENSFVYVNYKRQNHNYLIYLNVIIIYHHIMKLLCNVATGNRLAANTKRKHVKSTLALCKHPKSNDFYIILFTGQNKNGTKYTVKNNINQVFTKCLHDGKATIQFKEPPHDLYIQADAIQLKGFLHLFKRVLEQKVSDKELSFSSMAVTPISSKHIPPTKMFIKSRSEYPIKGFSKSLEILHITGIQKISLDRGILALKKLKVLNLSNNCIECLPKELNELPNLAELNVSENRLGRCTLKQWSWIGGNLSYTLKFLNLSSNGLRNLPDQIVKLHSLVFLNISKNELKSLPSGIGNLKMLRELTAFDNILSSLPGSVRTWQLRSLDLSNNNFDSNQQNNPAVVSPKIPPVCSLKESAARKFLSTRAPYSKETLPFTVVDYLDHAKYCVCGKACFASFIKHSQTLLLSSITMYLSLNSDELKFVPMDCYFCSLKCFNSAFHSRVRYPVI